MANYEGNSIKNREVKDQKNKLEKVVKGGVKPKKQSEFKKIAGAMINEEVKSIKNHTIYEIIIPTIVDTLSQIVKDAIDLTFHGEVRTSSKSSSTSRSRVGSRPSYASYYDDRRDDRRSRTSSRSERYSYDDLEFDYREDALEVLNSMEDVIEKYGVVTVGDLFDLADVSGNGPSDYNYGWTRLDSADVFKNRDGCWIIKLPRAVPIK